VLNHTIQPRTCPNRNRAGKAITSTRIYALTLIIYAIHHPDYNLDYTSHANQLIAPSTSMAQLALVLHALFNGNKELAKALTLLGATSVAEKLPASLYLEAYRACCDLGSESFRLATARLFFYHV